jgi:hypothetical protein
MRSNNTAAVCLACTVFAGRRLKRRVILLVDCFMCIVVLVLKITYIKVVLLRTVLDFVA